MPDTTIIYTKKKHIAHITLNRPQADNIVNQGMVQELKDTCSEINQDDSIYVAIITGAGGKVFCKGNEAEQLLQSGNITPTLLAELQSASTKYNAATIIASIERPVIAAINGDALGHGLELALSCDLRLTSSKAHFGFTQLASGFIPMGGGTQRLPRLIGKGKALELILTGETISAQEAFEIGLINQVVTEQDLASEAETLAQALASKAPMATRYIKEAVNKGMDLTLEQGLRLEADLYFLIHTTTDRKEGIKAFLEKRPALFKGR